jgi:hypothetical protein
MKQVLPGNETAFYRETKQVLPGNETGNWAVLPGNETDLSGSSA